MASNFVEVYEKHKNLKLAADELGIKWQTLYVKLKKLNIPVTGDKLRYGTGSDKLSAIAEREFSKIIPFAEDQNAVKFQSKIDFIVNGEKVDVKASRLKEVNKRCKKRSWAFSLKKQSLIADFFVCFGINDDESYKLFLIPGEVVREYQTITIPENGLGKWGEYGISKEDLYDFFVELADQ